VRNKEREAQRSVKHAEFVNHALQDMTIKKTRQVEALQNELSASAFLVKRAQAEIGMLSLSPLLLPASLFLCRERQGAHSFEERRGGEKIREIVE
jgi:lipopolysaccharide/colanic/teichoic acid biosynthesis glycosyltransferase